mmetsp:Transcript_29183/g.95211  ORF Transcript_29183/g.95211 Transcript_29183/m.95211 type:complete len:247 (-) Transcript_29183:970-1710(-)
MRCGSTMPLRASTVAASSDSAAPSEWPVNTTVWPECWRIRGPRRLSNDGSRMRSAFRLYSDPRSGCPSQLPTCGAACEAGSSGSRRWQACSPCPSSCSRELEPRKDTYSSRLWSSRRMLIRVVPRLESTFGMVIRSAFERNTWTNDGCTSPNAAAHVPMFMEFVYTLMAANTIEPPASASLNRIVRALPCTISAPSVSSSRSCSSAVARSVGSRVEGGAMWPWTRMPGTLQPEASWCGLGGEGRRE